MTATTHFMAGAAIGKLTGNPILAAVLGFLFHFVMDLVPHWDYGYYFERKLKSFLIAISDPLVGFLVYLIVGLFSGFSMEMWIVTFIGGFFCALPDVLGVAIKVFRLKRFGFFNRFHHDLVHWFIKEKVDPLEFKRRYISKRGVFIGILYQIPFLLTSLYFLVK